MCVRILISGSTGLVGAALSQALLQRGDTVARLMRPESQPARIEGDKGQENVAWNPHDGALGPNADAADAVVHLAGASIAHGRWTASRKRALRDSRVAATRTLLEALRGLPHPPRAFVAASAVGFYGSRGDEELTEASSAGADFLAGLARDWEAESARAADFGARVVILRFGVILAKRGGALPLMALPFRFGAGGKIGSGQQWISWIALADAVGVIQFALGDTALSGVANAVAPQPVRNADFAKTLGRVLHRPAFLPTPGFALRLALGEMTDALLLSSQRVLPKKLAQAAYRFTLPELEPALRAIFSKAG